MFRTTANNPSQKRTIRPLYAQTQATPWACFLDPTWNRSKDILPGMVMARTTGEQVTLFTGAANQVPFGFAALFVAPQLGIDETINTGSNNYAVWVGDQTSEFEILAPAFDTTATWTLQAGKVQYLTGNANGKLTPTGATAANACAILIDVVGTDKIIIQPVQPTITVGA